MNLVRFEPARELDLIQQEMNRLFDGFFGSRSPMASSAVRPRRWIPAMDAWEDGSDWVLRLDVPGMSEDDISVQYEDGQLNISGERQYEHHSRDGGMLRTERHSGMFERTVSLPKGVDAESIEASVTDGVLEVRVPQPEQVEPKKIQILGKNETDQIEETSTDSAHQSDQHETASAS